MFFSCLIIQTSSKMDKKGREIILFGCLVLNIWGLWSTGPDPARFALMNASNVSYLSCIVK